MVQTFINFTNVGDPCFFHLETPAGEASLHPVHGVLCFIRQGTEITTTLDDQHLLLHLFLTVTKFIHQLPDSCCS